MDDSWAFSMDADDGKSKKMEALESVECNGESPLAGLADLKSQVYLRGVYNLAVIFWVLANRTFALVLPTSFVALP